MPLLTPSVMTSRCCGYLRCIVFENYVSFFFNSPWFILHTESMESGNYMRFQIAAKRKYNFAM